MQDYLYNLIRDKSPGQNFCCGGLIVFPLKIFLWILSLIYGLLIRALRFFYRLNPYRLNCKVISVGNITLGGTGKTSLVEFIARYLKQQGHNVAVLSRGYKRKITKYELRNTNYEKMGDEAYMLSKNLTGVPVIVDTDRIRGAVHAINNYAVDTVILDDGFQQWRIKKDLEIVTIDATNPFGNRQLIPRGILREPLSSLRRTDIFILTKTNLKFGTKDIEDFLRQLNQTAPIFESIHNPLGFYKIDNPVELFKIEELRDNTVTLLSGIADPESFEKLIRRMNIQVGLCFKFPDHHNYTNEDLDKVIRACRDKNIGTIITTEKDSVRLQGLMIKPQDLKILVLKIKLKLIDEEGFCNRLLKLYSV